MLLREKLQEAKETQKFQANPFNKGKKSSKNTLDGSYKMVRTDNHQFVSGKIFSSAEPDLPPNEDFLTAVEQSQAQKSIEELPITSSQVGTCYRKYSRSRLIGTCVTDFSV